MLIVTATDLPRLLACNGSRLMIGSIPVVERDNTIRNEGNAADWVVQEVGNNRFAAEELIDRKAPNGVYITLEMVEHLEEYLDARTPTDRIEENYHIAGNGWQINGRWDRAKYDPASFTLYIDDLKYGWSIVEPDNNWTLISHAIGWMGRYGATCRVDRIVFTIYQPRPYHPLGSVRSWEIPEPQLSGLALNMQAVLNNLNDTLNTGKHCYNCPALATCPAARKADANAIDASEKAFIDDIDNPNLSFQLDHIDRAIKVLEETKKAYSELAEHRIKIGQNVPNYAIERGLSQYHFPKTMTVETLKCLTGFDLRKKDIMTPNQAIKEGVPKLLVEELRTRTETGTKLVRVDHNAKASKAFKSKPTPKGN